MILKNNHCQICKNESLQKIDFFSDLIRVTSDCRPYKKGGVLTVCQVCGAVQKINNATWRSELQEIYGNYFAYHQSGGEEQKVFDNNLGSIHSRSDVIVKRLKDYFSGGCEYSVMDVGCGSGVTLKAINRYFPKWTLNGFEIGEKNLDKLKKIKNFNKLYSGKISEIEDQFDVVTMVHSLEHFLEPREILTEISYNNKKYLFIEVCNIEENPFDILVADHLMHFSPNTLERIVTEAGFKVITIETSWVAKEISMLCHTRDDTQGAPGKGNLIRINPEQTYKKVSNYVMWLHQLVQSAANLITVNGSIGIFGSSIAATWLASHFNENIKFFVDEDESRIGKKHLGLPIISPDSVHNNSTILIPLPPKIAKTIYSRMNEKNGKYILPPEIIL